MSDITELEVLIAKEWQRGDELEKQMTNKQRLLEEVEDQKQKIIRRILEQQLAELQEENMHEEEQLMEIQKRKFCTLEEVYELEEKFAASVFFIFILYVLIFTTVFTDSYVIFIYISYADIVSFIVFDILIEKDEKISLYRYALYTM